jgi:uncharacterized protein
VGLGRRPPRSKGRVTTLTNDQTNAVLLFDTLGIFQWVNIAVDDENPHEVIREQFAMRRGWDIKSEPLDVDIWIPKGARDENSPKTHRDFTINCSAFAPEDWGHLFGLDIYQDRMGQLLNDAFVKVTLEGWHDGDKSHKAISNYSLSDLIVCVDTDRELRDTYAQETRRALHQQLTTYQRNPVFADQGTPLVELLRPGRMPVLHTR